MFMAFLFLLACGLELLSGFSDGQIGQCGSAVADAKPVKLNTLSVLRLTGEIMWTGVCAVSGD